MRQTSIYVVAFLAMNCNRFALAQEPDVPLLVAEADSAIQAQINKVYSFYLSPAPDGHRTKYEVLEELQRLKDITKEQDEIVKQLAIFVATTVSEEDMHLFAAGILCERRQFLIVFEIELVAVWNSVTRLASHG